MTRFAGDSSGMQYSNSYSLSLIGNNNELYGIGHHLREQGAIPKTKNLNEIVEMYMHLNAISIGTDAGSVMAATLAGGGVCPLDYKKVHQEIQFATI